MTTLLVCGGNSEGQLGLSGLESEIVKDFTPLESSKLNDERIIDVATGPGHTVVLTKSGTIYSFGNNDSGQLGRTAAPMKTPGRISFSPSVVKIQTVCCGDDFTVALSLELKLYSWGSNTFGQLGRPISCGANYTSEPDLVNLNEVIHIACGVQHCLALTTDCLHPVHIKALRSLSVIRVSCGEQHTAALTVDGRLFAFGGNSCGQLGHGVPRQIALPCNVPLPRQIMELTGSSVIDVACGRYHTVALMKDKLYLFGLGASGQLGLGSTENRALPTLASVVPEQGDESDETVPKLGPYLSVFAGGDHSMVLCLSGCSDDESTLQARAQRFFQKRLSRCLQPRISYLTRAYVEDCLNKGTHEILTKTLETVFSSLPCLNCSFLKEGTSHFYASRSNHGVNLDDVMECFRRLAEGKLGENFGKVIKQSLEWSLFGQLRRSPADIEALRVYLILPWSHVFDDVDCFRTLHSPFAEDLSVLTDIPKVVLKSWWTNIKTRHFRRTLLVFKSVVDHMLELPSLSLTDVGNQAEMQLRESTFKSCLRVMAMLNEVNSQLRVHKVPYDTFYVKSFVKKVDVRTEYGRYIMRQGDSFSFFDYPFIFDAEVKTLLFQTDALFTMQNQMQEAARYQITSLFFSAQPTMGTSPVLFLMVSRSNLVEDTINQLACHSSIDFKKPLKVLFTGEEADDTVGAQGGLRKEFFMLLFQEILDPKYGMFQENAESRRIWFTYNHFGDLQYFRLVGLLCGIAIYNSVLINLPFPLALYKKILNYPVLLEDLKDLSPTEGRSLEQVLDYEGDDFEDTFCLNFEVSYCSFGHTETFELKPDGKNLPVTKENRHEFVDLYVRHKLTESIRSQFDSFADGINTAANSRILSFFQPQELMEMVVGNQNYDWTELEKNTQYRGEYWKNHETIRLFWDVFHNTLTVEQKKKFLQFLTGSDRIPLLGMKSIAVWIQPSQGGEEYLPVAHTCFNLLDLPKFKSRDKLHAKLVEAIEHNQGFSLV